MNISKKINTVNGINYMNTGSHYHNENQLSEGVLANSTNINGIELKAYDIICYTCEGNLSDVFVCDPTLVNGMEFIHDIHFHNNGQVKVGEIAKSTTINGVVYQAYSRLSFDENGNVIDVCIDDEEMEDY